MGWAVLVFFVLALVSSAAGSQIMWFAFAVALGAWLVARAMEGPHDVSLSRGRKREARPAPRKRQGGATGEGF